MSNLKKVLALALALAMVMTMFAGASIKTVLDVKDADQFTDAQLQAASLLQPLGVLAGMGADELGAGKVTRAQMVAFIYRLTNGGDDGIDAYYSKTSQYKDVDTEAWYAPYLNWAYASKVAFGYTDGNFGVNDYVTGAQAAAMLVRLLGKEASGNDYALQAQSHAIALGLDDGITTRGLYENALDRGDMFILLANTLMCEVKDTTLAEEVFDLEIIYNVVLIGAEKTVGISKNDYTVFTFRGWTSNVDTLKFASRYLMVDDESDIAEDIGCKYTLLVSKSKDANGYRTLYAAYEAKQDGYYNVTTGTVDDGALVFETVGNKKQNVFFDKDCVFYVDEKVATKADFIAAYGKANWGGYKLIDNDGDGYIEYAIIERLTFAKLGTEKITAKVTAISAKGALTLTTADGTVYEGIKYGTYAATNANGSFKAWVDTTEDIQFALGIKQTGYAPFAGISDVYYDFDIVYNSEKTAGYVFAINVSEKTNYAGNYGILIAWNDWNNLYKNMAYATFMNENNEYFNAYVQTVNEMTSYRYAWDYVMDDGDQASPIAISELENALIYFTDGDYSDSIVSFDTANFWNNNYTYNWLEAFEWKEDFSESGHKVTFKDSVWSALTGKEDVDYSDIATYLTDRRTGNWGDATMDGVAVYAVISEAGTYKIWDAWNNGYENIVVGEQHLFDKKDNRLLDGLALTDYRDIEGKYLYAVEDDYMFYAIEDLDECLGFIYLKDATISVDYTGLDEGAEQFQIYRANGFWHLRFWSWITEEDIFDAVDLTATFGGKTYQLYYTAADIAEGDDEAAIEDNDNDIVDEVGDLVPGGHWYIKLADGTDPEGGIGLKAEYVRLTQVIKGFIDDEFTADVKKWYKDTFHHFAGQEGDKPYISKYTLLDTTNGVVFAYGKVVMDANHDNDGAWAAERWVAYDAETFNTLFYAFGDVDCDAMIGFEGDDWDEPGLCHDELIYTVIGGKTIVKALKVSSDCIELLPYGWIEKAGYEVVVFAGFTGAVNTNGWQIETLTLTAEGVKSETFYTRIGLGGAEEGDLLLIKRDENNELTSIQVIGKWTPAYLDYIAGGMAVPVADGTLRGAGVIDGDDLYGNYFRYTVGEGKTVVYIINGVYSNEYKDAFAGAAVNVVTAGNFVFVIGTKA